MNIKGFFEKTQNTICQFSNKNIKSLFFNIKS